MNIGSVKVGLLLNNRKKQYLSAPIVSQKDISQFILGNIPEDKQCLVINAALRGQKSLYGQDLKWKVTRKGDGNCEVK